MDGSINIQALDVVSEFTRRHMTTTEQLRRAPSTQYYNKMRQEIADKLRVSAGFTWEQAGLLVIGRRNYRGKKLS